MRLIALTSEPKCVCCKSPRRAEVDNWIARLGEKDGKGRTITWYYLTGEVMPLLLGRAAISESALKRHRNAHCKRIEGEAPAEGEVETPEWKKDEEIKAIHARIRELAADERVSPAALLDLQQKLYLLSLSRKIERGEAIEITSDQAARAADKLMQGEKAHEQGLLLGALGGAISQVFTKALSDSDHDEKPALIEGEVVHVEEAEVSSREGSLHVV